MEFKFLKTPFFILLTGFSLVILGIVIIVVGQFAGFGEKASYGSAPAMLGFLLIYVSGYSFVKAIVVKIAMAFLPKKLKEKVRVKEEEASEEDFHDLRDIHKRKEHKDPNKDAKSVVTRNR